MKNIGYCFFLLLFLVGCSSYNYEEPEYNYIASHVNIVDKASNFVVYEYSNIRVDEIAPVAAIYCKDHGGRQANLYDISLWRNNRRRATFVCK